MTFFDFNVGSMGSKKNMTSFIKLSVHREVRCPPLKKMPLIIFYFLLPRVYYVLYSLYSLHLQLCFLLITGRRHDSFEDLLCVIIMNSLSYPPVAFRPPQIGAFPKGRENDLHLILTPKT